MPITNGSPTRLGHGTQPAFSRRTSAGYAVDEKSPLRQIFRILREGVEAALLDRHELVVEERLREVLYRSVKALTLPALLPHEYICSPCKKEGKKYPKD